MNSIRAFFSIVCATITAFYAGAARADSERPNEISLSYSKSRNVFAKSIPAELIGQKGTTKVFRVKAKNKPILIAQYPWFAFGVYVGGKEDATLIRFGSWPMGHTLRADHMALGIYRNGKLIRKYSTLQMYRMGSGIRQSVSHYQIFSYDTPHFRRVTNGGNTSQYVFNVTGRSGKVFQFDLDSGGVVAVPAPRAAPKAKPTKN